MTDRRFAAFAAARLALFARPAAGDYDLTIQAVFHLGFTPDAVVDFDDLAVQLAPEPGAAALALAALGACAARARRRRSRA